MTEKQNDNQMQKMAGEIVMSNNPGQTMRNWRLQNNLKISELSTEMGIVGSVISDYELGRKSPGVLWIRKYLWAIETAKVAKAINKAYPKPKTRKTMRVKSKTDQAQGAKDLMHPYYGKIKLT